MVFSRHYDVVDFDRLPRGDHDRSESQLAELRFIFLHEVDFCVLFIIIIFSSSREWLCFYVANVQ